MANIPCHIKSQQMAFFYCLFFYFSWISGEIWRPDVNAWQSRILHVHGKSRGVIRELKRSNDQTFEQMCAKLREEGFGQFTTFSCHYPVKAQGFLYISKKITRMWSQTEMWAWILMALYIFVFNGCTYVRIWTPRIFVTETKNKEKFFFLILTILLCSRFTVLEWMPPFWWWFSESNSVWWQWHPGCSDASFIVSNSNFDCCGFQKFEASPFWWSFNSVGRYEARRRNRVDEYYEL